MNPSSRRTILKLCLVTSYIIDIQCLTIALVHDEGFDLLRPRTHAELWMTAVFDSYFGYSSQINVTHIKISSDKNALISQLTSVAVDSKFEGFVLAVTLCWIGDVIESFISSSKASILRLNFSPCPQSPEPGLKTERLQLYRMNEIYRDFCGIFAVNLWFKQFCFALMGNETQQLLVDRKTFSSLTAELQHCSQIDEIQWNPSRHPANAFNLSKDVDSLIGKKLRLTLMEEPPFVIFDRHPNGSISGYKGYCYEIVRLLQNMYNLTYEFILPHDGTFGKEMPDGSWNGMIGLVVDQTVDIGLGPFSVTHSRSKVVDFSVGFYEDGNAILIPPPAEENRLLVCLKPFRRETWFTLMCFAIILPILLWQCSNFLAINYQDRRPALAKQYFFVLGVLIGQSGQKVTPSIGFSAHLLGTVWCLSAVVFTSAYVGILMFFLRFPILSPMVSQLEELPGSHLKWVVLRGTALDSLFLVGSNNLSVQDYWRYQLVCPDRRLISSLLLNLIEGLVKQQHGILIDVNEEGVHYVTNGNYAYIAGKSNLESLLYDDYARSNICRLSIAKQEFFKVDVAFAFPKNSPLKPFIDKKILQMVEAGLGIYWKQLYWPPSGGKCGDVKQSDVGPRSLSLIDLQGAFVILAIGDGIAFAVFLIERFSSSHLFLHRCNMKL